MNKSIITIALVVALGVGAVLFLQNRKGQNLQQQLGVSETQGQGQPSEKTNVVVVYSDSGYSPKEVHIKRGDIVVFKNESSKTMWPATAFHPTHTIYPGSSILKCGTSEDKNIFDACREVESGKEWSFKFNEIGSWNYHDHLTPTYYGTIVVE